MNRREFIYSLAAATFVDTVAGLAKPRPVQRPWELAWAIEPYGAGEPLVVQANELVRIDLVCDDADFTWRGYQATLNGMSASITISDNHEFPLLSSDWPQAVVPEVKCALGSTIRLSVFNQMDRPREFYIYLSGSKVWSTGMVGL